MRTWIWMLLFLLCIGTPATETILKFDSDTVQTVSGAVEKVVEANWYGKEPNLLITVRRESSGDAILVDGGLVSLYQSKPRTGQKIQATGSIVKSEKGTVMLARTVTIGKRSVLIRKKNGVPTWISAKKRDFRKGRHSFMYRRMRHRRR